LKSSQKDILVCLKTVPKWMLETYPVQLRDSENVPARFGKDLTNPSSYEEQARAAFQLAARYGNNKSVDQKLIRINSVPKRNISKRG
jgi:hypothetical protein